MTYTVYEAMPLSQMLARVQKYYPGDGYKLVEKAYLFAQEAHKNQYRKSGEPYFTHPCFVASILVELSLDPPTIAAGLLHDTVEDCEGITLDTIRQEFGEEVAMLGWRDEAEQTRFRRQGRSTGGIAAQDDSGDGQGHPRRAD